MLKGFNFNADERELLEGLFDPEITQADSQLVEVLGIQKIVRPFTDTVVSQLGMQRESLLLVSHGFHRSRTPDLEGLQAYFQFVVESVREALLSVTDQSHHLHFVIDRDLDGEDATLLERIDRLGSGFREGFHVDTGEEARDSVEHQLEARAFGEIGRAEELLIDALRYGAAYDRFGESRETLAQLVTALHEQFDAIVARFDPATVRQNFSGLKPQQISGREL
jgi:hypothetical protein